nr:TraR/DksA C4-type zinc finger protein [uncultured Desulfobacter sp.]
MDTIVAERFKELLNQQLDQLLNQAKVSKSEMAQENTQSIDFLDRASVQTHQAMTLRFRTRESSLIKKVLLALDRIAKGTYGECEICGEPISLKRLEARPVTTKCISCKEAEEREEALAQ